MEVLMLTLETLLLVAGLLHFGVLCAAALVPFVLDWRSALAPLHPFLRKLVWVYGAFIALTIVGFGVISLTQSKDLAAGSPLARAICGLIGIFWLARLAIQLFLFDIRPLVRSRLLRGGNHALTAVFTYFAATYLLAAVAPRLLG